MVTGVTALETKNTIGNLKPIVGYGKGIKGKGNRIT
jgi:hypothetical protein